MSLPTRVGLAALLEDAENAERQLLDAPLVEQPSTARPDFAALLAQMTFDTAQPIEHPVPRVPVAGLLPITGAAFTPPTAQAAIEAAPAAGPPPLPLQSPGDLVLCIGLRADAEMLARDWAETTGAELIRCAPRGSAAADAVPDGAVLSDRRDAAAARARGVERGAACIAVLGLTALGAEVDAAGADGRDRQLGVAAGILPDQLWLVVDVGRKPEDTAAWVAACRDALDVHGVVAIGGEETSTPHSVAALGLPVLWAHNSNTRKDSLS
ncbi:hypothetical protein [Microterricola gilva]|nr:hypothetical protein [Microterricola gilva]